MSEKQRLKHIADNKAEQALLLYGTDKPEAEPTPDGLGKWEGGTQALKGSNRWVSERSHAQRTGDSKNAPSLDYTSKITHRQDADFNEIHTDADGNLFLYNVKTDKWDIPTDAQTIPFYEDAEGKTFAFNYKTGEWNIPVEIEYDVPENEAGYFDVA